MATLSGQVVYFTLASLTKMKRKRLIPFVVMLLFLSSCTCADNNDTGRHQAIHAEASESSGLPTWSENASSTESVVSSNQTIVLKDPTFEELRDFILKDPTSRNDFVPNHYECRHFATDINNNADVAGLRCAFVLLCFDRGQHAVVAFDTVDRGLVYIEPQTDARIHPEVGGIYDGQEIKEVLVAW